MFSSSCQPVKSQATHPGTSGKLRIAYLLSQYPAISHTFFLHEIAGLRNLGFVIETASINAPDRSLSQLPVDEAKEAQATFYVKSHSPLSAIVVLLRTLILNPGAFLRGLRASLRLDPAHVSRSLFALFYFVEALIVGDWMRRRKLDRMHIHFSGAVATVGMIAAVAFRFPYSLTVHGPDEFFDQELCFLRKKVECAERVICISDYCRSQLMRICSPEHWHKLFVARLGIEPEHFTAGIKTSVPGPIRLLAVGRLVPAKGQMLLLQSVEELRARGVHIRVKLVGDGPQRATLERFVRNSSLTDRVTFAGSLNRDQIRTELEQADIFVLPSFAEGIPVALMEAMAMNVPCISTFVAGIPELIRHEQDGLLVPAGSVEALVDAVEQFATRAEFRERLARSGRSRVLEHYNLHTNLQRLATVLTATDSSVDSSAMEPCEEYA